MTAAAALSLAWRLAVAARNRRMRDEQPRNSFGDGRIRILQQGYTVRTTVRSLTRENSVRAALGKVVDAQDRLSFHAAALTSDAGWDVATSGCDFVLHVASPVTLSQPKKPR
jgi:nucleoside-diphosphate-sugar epimerase